MKRLVVVSVILFCISLILVFFIGQQEDTTDRQSLPQAKVEKIIKKQPPSTPEVEEKKVTISSIKYFGNIKISAISENRFLEVFHYLKFENLSKEIAPDYSKVFYGFGVESSYDEPTGNWINENTFKFQTKKKSSTLKDALTIKSIPINTHQKIILAGRGLDFSYAVNGLSTEATSYYYFEDCEWAEDVAPSQKKVLESSDRNCDYKRCRLEEWADIEFDWNEPAKCNESSELANIVAHNRSTLERSILDEIGQRLTPDWEDKHGTYCQKHLDYDEDNKRCKVFFSGKSHLHIPVDSYLKYNGIEDSLVTSCGFKLLGQVFPSTSKINLKEKTVSLGEKQYSFHEIYQRSEKKRFSKIGIDLCKVKKIITDVDGILEYETTEAQTINGISVPKGSLVTQRDREVLFLKLSENVVVNDLIFIKDKNIRFEGNLLAKATVMSLTEEKYPWTGHFTTIYQNELPIFVVPTEGFEFVGTNYKAFEPIPVNKDFSIKAHTESAEIYGYAENQVGDYVHVTVEEGSPPLLLSFINVKGQVGHANLLYTYTGLAESCEPKETLIGVYEDVANNSNPAVLSRSLTFNGLVKSIISNPFKFEKISYGDLSEKQRQWAYRDSPNEGYFVDNDFGFKAIWTQWIGYEVSGYELFWGDKNLGGATRLDLLGRIQYRGKDIVWASTAGGRASSHLMLVLTRSLGTDWVVREIHSKDQGCRM